MIKFKIELDTFEKSSFNFVIEQIENICKEKQKKLKKAYKNNSSSITLLEYEIDYCQDFMNYVKTNFIIK